MLLDRKDGVLTLKVNLVQKPITLTQPRTIVFGLMASPGKPMPADWRSVQFAGGVKGHKLPVISLMGSQYWGSDEVCRYANRAYIEWFGISNVKLLYSMTLEGLPTSVVRIRR